MAAACQKRIGSISVPPNNGFVYDTFTLPADAVGILLIPSTADLTQVLVTGVQSNGNYINLAAANTSTGLGNTPFGGFSTDGDRLVRVFGATKIGGGRTSVTVVALFIGSIVLGLIQPGGLVQAVSISGNVQTVGGPTTSNSLAYGIVNAPGAGVTIVTASTPNTGFYDVRCRVGYGAAAGTLIDNFTLWVGATFWRSIFPRALAANQIGSQEYIPRLAANAGDGITIKTLNADAGTNYLAELDVIQVA